MSGIKQGASDLFHWEILAEKVQKANPYHDGEGQFTSKDKAVEGLTEKLHQKEAGDEARKWRAKSQKHDDLFDADRSLLEQTDAQYMSLTDSEKEGLYAYTHKAYMTVNRFLGDSDYRGLGDDNIRARIDQIDRVMDKMTVPEDIVVFRSVNLNRLTGGAEITNGMTMRDPGYASTSVSLDIVTDVFGDPDRHVVALRVPKGAKGAYVGNSDVRGHNPDEYELLLPRDRVYQVVGKKKVSLGGKTAEMLVLDLVNPTGDPLPRP